MDVFDTNVWTLGLTETDANAASLVDEVKDGDRTVGVSAYIYCEVMDAIQSASYVENRYIDQTLHNFATLVENSECIWGPDHADVEACDLGTERTTDEVRLIEALSGVESKDAPILAFAYARSRVHQDTKLYTADRSFASFDPVSEGLHQLRVEYVDAS